MSFVQNFPFFNIILCLICAVTTFATGERWGRRLTVSLLSLSAALNGAVLWYCAANHCSYSYMMGHYPAPWGNELLVGVLEPLMATLFSLVMLLSVLGGMAHIRRDIADTRRHIYWISVDMALVALLALSYTNDIFTGYVFIEICTLAACGLLCARQHGRNLLSAVRYMVFALVGSGLFLIGVVLTYSITGHLLFPQLHETIAALWQEGTYKFSMTVSIALMTAGLAIKSGLFLFHFWMPEAYGNATPSAAAILSGVVSKGYIFLLIKVIYRAVGIEVFLASGAQNILLVLGICGMVVCSFSAIAAKKLKTMVAYSSAAQIGYIFMGLGMGTEAALLASLLQVVSHALTKSMLFLSSAQLSDASGGHTEFPPLRGAAHRNITAGLTFTAGALSMVGVPLMVGFIPKLHFAAAAFDLGWQRWPVLLALAISTVLNVGYFLYTAIVLWLPQRADCPYGKHSTHWDEAVPTLILMVLGIAIGVYSAPLTQLLQQGMTLFTTY